MHEVGCYCVAYILVLSGIPDVNRYSHESRIHSESECASNLTNELDVRLETKMAHARNS